MKPALFAAVLCALLSASACKGKKGGQPTLRPNAAPVLQVPAGLSGAGPRFTFLLPHTGSQSLTFAATDPDADPLLWQVVVDAAAAAAAGIGFATPVAGSTFRLEFAPVGGPGSVTLALLVEDPRGSAAAIDLLVVRTGPPSIGSVTPDNAFSNKAQQVAITGSGLRLGGTVPIAVTFGGLQATNVVASSETMLTCATPITAAPGSLAVGVGTVFGTASLPSTAFTAYFYPPRFLFADQRLDAGAAAALHLAGDGLATQAVWLEANAVVHRRSADAGVTWQAAQTLSGAQVASEPQVLIAGADVAVAWIAAGDSVWWRRSSDGGATFAPAQRLDPAALPGMPASRLRLARSGDRHCAAWLVGTAGLGTARVMAAASSDGGATWSAPALVSDGLANQGNHELACDGANAYVLVLDDRLGAPQRGVYVVRSADGGGSWGVARRLSAPASAAAEPRLGAQSGRVHACWLQSGVLNYAASADQGLSWGSTVHPVQGSISTPASSPSLCCAADRVFLGYVLGGSSVWVSRFSPLGSAVQHTQVDSTATLAAETRIACSGNYVFLAYRNGDVGTGGARVHLVASGDSGATFSTTSIVGDGTASQTGPQLLCNSARLQVGWIDSRGAQPGVFVNRTAQ